MPSPPRKLVSVGTVARTEPSPPANHAQPVRAGRRTGGSRIPGSVGLFSSCVKAVLIEIEETPDSPASWPRAGPGGDSGSPGCFGCRRGRVAQNHEQTVGVRVRAGRSSAVALSWLGSTTCLSCSVVVKGPRLVLHGAGGDRQDDVARRASMTTGRNACVLSALGRLGAKLTFANIAFNYSSAKLSSDRLALTRRSTRADDQEVMTSETPPKRSDQFRSSAPNTHQGSHRPKGRPSTNRVTATSWSPRLASSPLGVTWTTPRLRLSCQVPGSQMSSPAAADAHRELRLRCRGVRGCIPSHGLGGARRAPLIDTVLLHHISLARSVTARRANAPSKLWYPQETGRVRSPLICSRSSPAAQSNTTTPSERDGCGARSKRRKHAHRWANGKWSAKRTPPPCSAGPGQDSSGAAPSGAPSHSTKR